MANRKEAYHYEATNFKKRTSIGQSTRTKPKNKYKRRNFTRRRGQ